MKKVFAVLLYPFKVVKRYIQKHKITKLLQNTNISKVDNLTGYDFEVLVEIILSNCGFKCDLTPKSKDNGVDIIAKKGSITLAIQTKLYFNHSVGNKGVQEIYTGKNFYNANVAVLITNSMFSKNAQVMAEKLNVSLVNRENLETILKNTNKENGLFFDKLIYENLKRNENERKQ